MLRTPDEEIVGRRFGRLVGVRAAETVSKHRRFIFLCDCGVEKSLNLGLVKAGNTKSCGCLRRDVKLSTMSAADRLVAAVEYDLNTGCWLWARAADSFGYGFLTVDGVMWRAHRRSYLEFVGPLPEGLHVCHRCDTPACINPRHLFLGDARANAIDMGRKGRAGMTRHPGSSYFARAGDRLKGENASRAKLTDADVAEIRRLRATGRTQLSLAKQFKVSLSYIEKLNGGRARRPADHIRSGK